MTLYQARQRVQEINMRTDISEQAKSMIFANLISGLIDRAWEPTEAQLGDEFTNKF